MTNKDINLTIKLNRNVVYLAAIFILVLLFSYAYNSKAERHIIDDTEPDSITYSKKVENGNLSFEIRSKCSEVGDNFITRTLKDSEWKKYVVGEYFYSPERNSCYASVIGFYGGRNDGEFAYMIWDTMSNELVFFRDTTLTQGQDIGAIYDNAVAYLKGTETLRYSEDSWNSGN